jgi:hypothetical protein
MRRPRLLWRRPARLVQALRTQLEEQRAICERLSRRLEELEALLHDSRASLEEQLATLAEVQRGGLALVRRGQERERLHAAVLHESVEVQKRELDALTDVLAAAEQGRPGPAAGR